MVESNAAKSASTWAKGSTLLTLLAIASIFVAPAFYVQDAPNVLTADQLDNAVQKAVALQMQDISINVTEGPKTVAIYEEIFEQDAWESEAEVLAKEELENKDYKELGEFLFDKYGNIEDEDDITDVIVKDVTVSETDVDDKDATVELKLKVYYEKTNEDSVKKYVTATAGIEDGEVEEFSFAETD